MWTRKDIKMWMKKAKDLWQLYRRNKLAVVGLSILILFVFVALLAPLISPYGPFAINLQLSFGAPTIGHLMGTDDLGRDLLSRWIYGSRVSLLVGFLAAATSISIGIVMGSVSGFFGGKTDALLMRITEFFQVIPRFFLALLLVTMFGISVWNIILAIGILSWPTTARIVRAQYLSLKEREFVEASRSLGVPTRTIIFGEIFPNAMPPVVVNATFDVAEAILLEATLGFLGLGDPRNFSWGFLLNNAQDFVFHGWWMAFFPGLAILLVVTGLNLIGDGLTDALSPKLREK